MKLIRFHYIMENEEQNNNINHFKMESVLTIDKNIVASWRLRFLFRRSRSVSAERGKSR